MGNYLEQRNTILLAIFSTPELVFTRVLLLSTPGQRRTELRCRLRGASGTPPETG